ncbi:phage tail terminator-like protein [Brevundimonas sp. NIBR11]|uniref:phage tail terminator-like protein n=1 Tax=Brevundimonas sp. NIBR11 TaxID=3015999 RepID=UPI0022F12873|nr:phage tail terminator-like protein [Brevundimonas sp. NIBR11]WGM31498.1 hypothetical protein KKHFBJBL_01745 [Brevundimonas sp. NIBR11]
MADPAVVTALLLQQCESLVISSPAMPIAYPDVAFSPPADGKYLRVELFKNAPFWEGLASGRIDQGLLQIMVVWPRNRGIIKPAEVAALVEEHFKKGTRMTGSGVTVKVNREPYSSSPITSPDKSETPVTIPWIAV